MYQYRRQIIPPIQCFDTICLQIPLDSCTITDTNLKMADVAYCNTLKSAKSHGINKFQNDCVIEIFIW